MLGSLIVLGSIAVAITYAAIARDLDRRVAGASADLLRSHAGGGRAALLRAIHAHDITTTTGVSFALFAPDGAELAGRRDMPPPQLGWADVEMHDPIEGSDPVRTLTVPAPGGDRLTAMGNRRPLMMAQRAIGWLFVASILLVALLCSFTGWLLARYLRHRLRPIAATAAAVREGDMRHRVPVSTRGDEFDEAAAALNLMLDRVAGLMQNLRQVSSDLAHDLRTPLTRIRVRLERLRDGDVGAEAIAPLIGQVDALVDLFNAILRIAAIDGVPRSEGRVDLEAVALDVVGALSPTFAETGRTLTLSSDHDAVIAGDAAQIGAVLVNLLENVLRHAGPGAAASVLVRRGRAGVSLTVRDTGPGVPAEEASRIFDRFVRLDRSRSTPGHGLGLSLVRSVATAHDAAISVQTEAGGFAVTLTFPACRHG